MKAPVFSPRLLRDRRKDANLTRQALASSAGVSMTALADIETGRRKTAPHATTLAKLAAVLGCTLDELFEEPADEDDRPSRSFGHLRLVAAS